MFLIWNTLLLSVRVSGGEARDIFEYVISTLLSQHRLDNSTHSDDYKLPMRQLAHIIATNDPQEVDRFIQQYVSALDSEQSFLVVSTELMEVLNKHRLSLSSISASIINNRVSKNFWQIERKYEQPALRNTLNYYLELKNIILAE